MLVAEQDVAAPEQAPVAIRVITRGDAPEQAGSQPAPTRVRESHRAFSPLPAFIALRFMSLAMFRRKHTKL
jgi:hypothetical protein